ncbi:30S ribosomal protein S4 [archaeon]|jgi:small subunit ribosomal protein S4|nr:30S ribosomal protein S4 [archaeon]
MKRKHKQYSKPKRPFDKGRIDEEAGIKTEYGLKNKREIWRAEAKVRSMRQKAKKLITAPVEEQKALFTRLQKIGLNVNSIADVLGLEKKDYLDRRLQTVVAIKGLAPTTRTARQLIVHKKVLVDGRAISSPSYIVPVELEGKITIKEKIKRPKVDKEMGEKVE